MMLLIGSKIITKKVAQMKIKCHLETGYVGTYYEDEIEVPDDYTDQEIEEEVSDYMMQNISIWWEHSEEK